MFFFGGGGKLVLYLIQNSEVLCMFFNPWVLIHLLDLGPDSMLKKILDVVLCV